MAHSEQPKKTNIKNKQSTRVLWVALFSYLLILLCEATAQEDLKAFWEFFCTWRAHLVLLNTTLLIALLFGAFYRLTTKLWVGVVAVGIPFYVFHVINAFKLLFRNEPLYPWDLSLASELGNIAGSMNIRFSLPMILGMVYLLAMLVVAIVFDVRRGKEQKPSYKRSFLAGVCLLALFAGSSLLLLNKFYLALCGIDTISFDQKTSYHENGFFYSFTANAYKTKVTVPEGYDQHTVVQLAEEYETEEAEATVRDPNVIIVMSEAFADIWNAKKLHFNEEIAPNYTALAKKYLSGNTMTSEFGGNTANCEFEVLTGYSTALLPSGTVAYMNYVNDQVDSYVSYLDSKGYYTVALHPYLRSFFSREKAYEVLGFDAFYSEEYFEGAQRLRMMQYISDDAVVDRIISEYEKNEETTARPFFCHTVTMQNHASFYEEDFPVEEQIDFTADCELEEEEYIALRSYVTGLQVADAALGKLVDYFEQVEEPTVIVFFGDHQPSLYGDTRELMARIGYVEDEESAEGLMALQSTPYLIWNNFEEKPTHVEEDLSMFHLLPYMTRTLGLSRPVYYSYLDSLYEDLRGWTRQVACDGEGNAVLELTDETQKKFDEYLLLVYDGLMGKRYANDILYP